jgi:hypothetical protein
MGFWLGAGVLALAGMAVSAADATAFCGCDKPPPPRAQVRPAFGHPDQAVTLFDERLEAGARYKVVFTSRDGSSDWSLAKAGRRADMADARVRRQLRVRVPEVALGPTTLSIYDAAGTLVYELPDDEFTVIAPPVALDDIAETITREGYRTGVGADGTVYLAFDLSSMSDATTYTGVAEGFDLQFDGASVAIFNTQGVLGEVLDPDSRTLFRIAPGGAGNGTALTYWRHEFRSYKDQHRKRDERMTHDGEWHVDGSRHIDNEHLVVAIAGALANGQPPRPGATPPFRLVVSSMPAPANPLR